MADAATQNKQDPNLSQLDTDTRNRLKAALGGALARELANDKTLTLPGIGNFRRKKYAARNIPDINRPGKLRRIPAQYHATFHPTNDLKESAQHLRGQAESVSLQSVAHDVHLEFADLANHKPTKELLALLPERTLRRYQIAPFELDNDTLKLAMVDPGNHEAIELVRKTLGKKVVPYLTTQSELNHVFDQSESGTAELAELAQEAEETIEAIPQTADEASDTAEGSALEHAPAAKLISQVLKRAVREHASDIHIEPGPENSHIRFRVDGVLQAVATVPKGIHTGLVARIKVLTNLRLDEHRLPQDGRFRAIIDHGEIDFRVSILPMVDGEKVVLRILDKSAGILTLDRIGLRGQQSAVFEEEIHKPHGMILVTGPTGSGKTTTLYAAIDKVKTVKTNITTLEDPVEYRLSGINQSQINPDIGFTFAAGLRSILRQDPNVILVGEIRDTETAEIAVHAALTGHIVLSTLHTNDAAGAIPRLVDMGIEPFLITSSLNAVVAQRLVRKICDKCRAEISTDTEIAPEVSQEITTIQANAKLIEGLQDAATKLAKPTFFKGQGCPACNNTGYSGRMGIYEILPITEELKPLIANRTDAEKLAEQAVAMGMLTIRQDGILKALDGLTTIEEVWRVTKI